MIQFNLLPDVKLEYIKAERTKRLFVTVSFLAAAVAVGVLVVLLLTVDGVQKKNLSDLNGDIRTNTSKLQNTQDLNKVLTIQNQLAVLTKLHDDKPVGSRFFTYLAQVTPAAVTISNASVDFTANTITVSGNSPSLDAINTYVDTLKFTGYTTPKNSTSVKAFKDVVLASFSRTTDTTTYTITLSYDPIIFSETDTTTLSVPNTVTTRSVTEQPTDLFKTSGSKQ